MIPVPPRPRFYGVFLKRPPTAIAWVASIAVFGLGALLNLGVLGGVLAGVAYSLPMCLCLWTRNRLLLYFMAIAGSVLTFYKTAGLMGDYSTRLLTWSFQLVNIWIPALAFHLAIYSFDRLDLKRKLLLDANEELDSANHELGTREQEVLQQNKMLQSQAEELERQAEELRQGAEELEQQTVELHTANDELTRRERGLQTLLESARWLRSDLSERDVMSAICQAAVQVMEEGVAAAAIVHSQNGKLALRGHYGFGVHGTLRDEVPFAFTFAALVIGRRQTAFIADTHARPDLLLAQPAAGRPFRSLLSTPLTIEGRLIGAVEVYAHQPREWTDGEFKVIEWLSAQCSLAIQAIEYQQEVVVKRREAEEASIQKTRFLAAISHDVRTPANAISLMADLIEQSATDERAANSRAELVMLARDLKTSARSLVELVSDVLDLARLDTGKLDLQTSDFPLALLLENEVRQFEHAASEKSLELILHPLPDRLHLRTDRMKLARIIANLLGNAIKFTEKGSIEVRTALQSDSSLMILISDTGVGISAEALPRIFDEFYQIQNPEHADRNKGAGLGLAICKRLVDALGCTLGVTSEFGPGTTFTIAVPRTLLIQNATPLQPPTPLPANSNSLHEVRILIVEDHDITRRAASRLLSSHGALILEARSGREALHMLVHDQPHVMLLDLMLPDGDGTDILKHLRLYRSPSLRCILAVSGDVRGARVSEVMELGADGLLAKPLDIEKLISAITTHLAPPG